MKKKLYTVILIFTIFTVITQGNNMMKKNRNVAVKNNTLGALCKGMFPNGSYSGAFEVSVDGELNYYTEYLEIENGEIRIYPTFNFQTRELSFNIKDENVKVVCK